MDNQEENESDTDSYSSQSDSDYETETPSKLHKCTYDSCKKSFHRPSKLADHIRRHTEERLFKCESLNCEKKFYTRQHLKRHLEKFHLKKIENAMCPIEGCLQVMRKNSLQKHILRKHNSLRKYKFQCKECGKGVRSELELKQHSNEHTDMYRCGVCDKVFQKGYRFQAHLKTHDKKYECDCQQLFCDFNSYQQHKKMCIRKNLELRCEVCHKVFSTKFNLEQHEKTHLDSKPTFECSYEGCSRHYNQKRNLTQHIRTFHLKLGDNTSWICDVCQKNFKAKIYLKKHHKKFHENPVTPTDKTRKPRCDKGIPKVPMITLLTGFEYTEEKDENRENINGETLQEQSNFMDDFLIGGLEAVPSIEN